MSSFDTQAYDLPLSRTSFLAALEEGRGRAMLHASRHGLGGFHRELIHACLHALQVDPQIDKGRGEWTLALLEIGNALDDCLPAILEGLEPAVVLAEGLDFWDRVERCNVLAALASRGLTGARERLLQIAVDDREWHFGPPLGADHFVDIEGIDGLVALAEGLGPRARELCREDLFALVVRGDVNEQADAANEDLVAEARSALAEAAPRCAGAAALLGMLTEDSMDGASPASSSPDPFVDGTEQKGSGQGSSGRPAFAYEDGPHDNADAAIEWVESRAEDAPEPASRFGVLSAWSRKASPRALEQLARAWCSTGSALRRILYAQAFCKKIPPPFVTQEMIAMARSPSSKLAWVTTQALSGVTDPMVRALALERIADSGLQVVSLELLQSNYQASDGKLLESAFNELIPCGLSDLRSIHSTSRRILDGDKRCSLARGLLELARPDRPELALLQLAAYELNPCAECRVRHAKALHAIDALPAWLRDEVLHDPESSTEDWPWV